jgi:predicted DNA-binding protein (UPF0251 family)
MRPGRPRCPRRIETEPVTSYFKPRGVPLKELDTVQLSVEELESVRLSDLEGLEQEEAAQRMGISRRALWDDLQSARRKIADALVNGKAIEIGGGDYTVARSYACPGCRAEWSSSGQGPERCPQCGRAEVSPAGKDRETGCRRGRCCDRDKVAEQ